MEVVARRTKLTRLVQDSTLRMSWTTLRRVGRRAIFEVAATAEEIHLRWQQRSVNDTIAKESLAEGIAWTDLPQRLRCNCRQQHLLDVKWRDQISSQLSSFSPAVLDLIATEADRTCEHVFDLLGSGPTPLGEKIDWHTDFKTGHRWNPKTYYKRIRPAPYPGGYDIKVPWELSRCQHFVRLGQAYWITGDEKYAREFVAQVEDWIASNPWPWGVNWACTMDVAIRAVNWLWGYAFFKDSPSLTDDFLVAFYKSLLVHGRHIYKNLENQEGFTNNHYLADLVGLIYLGILCPEFKEASEWREFGLRELWKEMFKQVYPDGVSFEASIPYHRLVTEFFLYTVILCQRNDIPVPDEVMARLEKMLEFVMYYTKPDGTVPLIGDGDNGRLVRLEVWDPPDREWIDHRYLLVVGAVLFGRPDFARAAGDQWEEAVWLLGDGVGKTSNRALRNSLAPQKQEISSTFPDGGIYILRGPEDEYLMMNAGPNGQNGRGGHAHNDMLSFEFYSRGKSWILDPGTYSYTSDYQSRHLFRSTVYHNTPVVICNQVIEQHQCCQELPFVLSQQAQTQVALRTEDRQMQKLDLRLSNYGGRGICIERFVIADFRSRVWIIEDRLIAPSDCGFQLSLHLADVALSVIDVAAGGYLLEDESKALLICCLTSGAAKSRISRAWISPCYGIRYRAPVLEFLVSKEYAASGFVFGLCSMDRSCKNSLSDIFDAMIATKRELGSWTNL